MCVGGEACTVCSCTPCTTSPFCGERAGVGAGVRVRGRAGVVGKGGRDGSDSRSQTSKKELTVWF